MNRIFFVFVLLTVPFLNFFLIVLQGKYITAKTGFSTLKNATFCNLRDLLRSLEKSSQKITYGISLAKNVSDSFECRFALMFLEEIRT